MRLAGKFDKWMNEEGTMLCIPLQNDETGEINEFCSQLEEFTEGEEFSLKIEKKRKKRSLDANAYFWVLVRKLANKLQIDYKDCYKQIVKQAGWYEILPVRNDIEADFKAAWESRGIGWPCERLGESKLNGYTNYLCYMGTSEYNSQQMARMLDSVIDECKRQGIPVMTPDEVAHLKELMNDGKRT